MICHGAEVTLEWDTEDEDLIEGYRLYIKEGALIESGDEDLVTIAISPETPGFDPTAPSFTITDLEDDLVYYFAVTAQDGNGNESALSNQVAAKSGVEVIPFSHASSASTQAGCLIDTVTKKIHRMDAEGGK